MNKPMPPKPTLFTNITRKILDIVLHAVLYSIPLYFIWNFGISQELHIQELSYSFFICVMIFMRVFLFSTQLADIKFTLDNIYNLLLLDMSRRIVNNGRQPTVSPEILTEEKITPLDK